MRTGPEVVAATATTVALPAISAGVVGVIPVTLRSTEERRP